MRLEQIKEIDQFGPKIELRLGKNKNHKTFCGAAMTIFVVACCVIALIIVGQDIIRKDSPTVLSSEILDQNNSLEQINQYGDMKEVNLNDLMLRVSVRDSNGYILDDENMNRIEIKLQLVSKNNSQYKYNDIQLKECENSDMADYQIQLQEGNNLSLLLNEFSFFIDFVLYLLKLIVAYLNLFNIDLNESSYYCLQQSKTSDSVLYTLFGESSQSNSQYIEFQITCKSECSNLYAQHTSLKAIILFRDRYFNPSDYALPYKDLYRETEIDFKLNSNGVIQQQQYSLPIKKVTIYTDQGILYSSYQSQHFLSVQSLQTAIAQEIYQFSFILQLNVTTYRSVYKRSYMKLQELLAIVGGLMKALMVIGRFFVKPISKLSMNTELVNELFFFEGQNKKKRDFLQFDTIFSNSKESNNIEDKQLKFLKNQQEGQQHKVDQEFYDKKEKLNKSNERLDFQKNENSLELKKKSSYKNDFVEEKRSQIVQQPISSMHNSQKSGIANNFENQKQQEGQECFYQDEKQKTNFISNNIKNFKQNNYNQNYKQPLAQEQLSQKQQQSQQSSIIKWNQVYQNEQVKTNKDFDSESQSNQLESNNNQKDVLAFYSEINSNNQKLAKSNIIEHAKSIPKNLFLRQGTNLITKILKRNYEIRSGNRSQTKQEQGEANEIFSNVMSEIQEKPLKFHCLDYFKFYFGKFKCLKKKKQISFSVKQITQRLDIIYILQKLVEIDKLKVLLLSDEQRKLFEYFPKPCVRKDPFQEPETLEQLKNNTQNGISKTWTMIQPEKENLDKFTEAFHAFKYINQKEEKEPLDQRLIDMLDPDIKRYFDKTTQNKTKLFSNNDIDINNQKNNDKRIHNKKKITNSSFFKGKEQYLKMNSDFNRQRRSSSSCELYNQKDLEAISKYVSSSNYILKGVKTPLGEAGSIHDEVQSSQCYLHEKEIKSQNRIKEFSTNNLHTNLQGSNFSFRKKTEENLFPFYFDNIAQINKNASKYSSTKQSIYSQNQINIEELQQNKSNFQNSIGKQGIRNGQDDPLSVVVTSPKNKQPAQEQDEIELIQNNPFIRKSKQQLTNNLTFKVIQSSHSSSFSIAEENRKNLNNEITRYYLTNPTKFQRQIENDQNKFPLKQNHSLFSLKEETELNIHNEQANTNSEKKSSTPDLKQKKFLTRTGDKYLENEISNEKNFFDYKIQSENEQNTELPSLQRSRSHNSTDPQQLLKTVSFKNHYHPTQKSSMLQLNSPYQKQQNYLKSKQETNKYSNNPSLNFQIKKSFYTINPKKRTSQSHNNFGQQLLKQLNQLELQNDNNQKQNDQFTVVSIDQNLISEECEGFNSFMFNKQLDEANGTFISEADEQNRKLLRQPLSYTQPANNNQLSYLDKEGMNQFEKQ